MRIKELIKALDEHHWESVEKTPSREELTAFNDL